MRFRERLSEGISIKSIVLIAVFAAIAEVLSLFLSFPIPLMPSFVKFDFSLIPVALAVFLLGPISGMTVVLIKSLLHLLFSTTLGIGTLFDFVISIFFILGIWGVLAIAKKRTLPWCVISVIVGAIIAGLVSIPLNLYVVYPAYTAMMSMDKIIASYQKINPNVSSLPAALTIFNLPFTFVKFAISGVLGGIVGTKIKSVLDRI